MSTGIFMVVLGEMVGAAARLADLTEIATWPAAHKW
jgi:hypothetical protein